MPGQDFNVTDPIFEWAQRAPYAVAIIDGSEIIHYRNLWVAVRRAMSTFHEADWQPGDVIAISMRGSFALQMTVSLALARAAIAQVWLPPHDPIEYRLALARNLDVKAVITDDDQGRLEPIESWSVDAGWLSPWETAAVPSDRRVDGAGRTLIFIQSSGTTGTPKEIVVTHDDERTFAARNNHHSACWPGERCMFLTGLQFWTGLARALRCLANGAAIVTPPPNRTMADLKRAIDLHGVTYLWCAPLHVNGLLEGIDDDLPRLPGLRFFCCSSGALSFAATQEARRRISPNLSIQYGSNEAGGITAAPPALVERYPDCVGLPLPGIELQVVDENDQPVPIDTLGHVRIRGASISPARMRGAAPGATVAYKGDWFYPGDIGLRNAEGILFLKGRSDEVMNFNGIMIGPDAIESVLRGHPAVRDAAAFPVPSPVHQDVPAAAVVLRSPVSLKELSHFCTRHLGNRAPKLLFVVHSIPRSAIGKVLRRRLTEFALAQVVAARGRGEG